MLARPDLRLWGKSDPELGRYPLLAHLLDSAAAAWALWDGWLRCGLRQRLGRLVPDDPRGLFCVAAGAHDLGKATPQFQGRLFDSGRGQMWDALCLALGQDGYWFPEPAEVAKLRDVRNGRRPWLRHEYATYKFLRDNACWPDTGLTLALGGHHGRYCCPVDPFNQRPAYGYLQRATAGLWADQAMAHLHAVTAVTGVDLQRALAQAPGLTGVDVVLWTGCISLADWLASADEAVSAGTAQLALLSSGQHSMYLSRRVDWFADNVAQTLGKAETPSDDFEAEFGFAPTRSIHSWAVRSSARGLSIIAAPTGEGKTEAGLALHQHAEPAESLFFALPTTATADAMFERVRAFYRGTAQYGALVHSRAILNNYYAPMATPRLLTTDVHNEGLTPSAWFRGRHKSILAPVAVGTCDQALAAVLKHRYNFMRLCGLANKHLILDEVHTYDPYMDYLLTKLLVWCGATGTRVTILTATLPARRTSAYLSAFALGAGWAHTSPAVYTYPYIAHITAGGASYTHVQAHRQYRLQLDYIYTADATDGLVRAARELAAQHPEAKIAVIANTVQRCISVAAQLDDRMPIILHARMTGQQRSRATQAIERAAGKDRQAGGVLVVGTQVLEASLDLDFDIMVTEFAPAASLLQRAGRLWRHNRPSRPVSSPTVHIVVPMTPGTGTDISNTPAWAGSEMAIPYEPLALTKTWDSLVQGQRRHIDIPDDVQALVDSADVSWEDVCRADKPTEAALARLASQQSAAGVRAIEPEDLLGDGMGNQPAVLAETTRGELADDEYATRYTELDSLTVLIYDPTASHPAAFPGSTQELQTARHPDDIIDILSYTIPTTGKTADALRQAGQPELLRHHPWPLLRDVCPIHIDRLPPGTSLHQTLGLITGATNAPQQSQL